MKAPIREARGFSLIEVLIAIAIFSFAVVSLIGLLSVSLSTGQAAASDSAMATMTQSMMSSLKSGDFAQLAPVTSYFDVRGTRLVHSDGTDVTLAEAKSGGGLYQCVVTTSAVQPLNSSFTGSGPVLMAVTLDFSWPVEASVPTKHKTIRTCVADYD